MFSPTTHPRWRAPWGLLVFLLAYLILIAVVSRYYLLPALEVIRNATPASPQKNSSSIGPNANSAKSPASAANKSTTGSSKPTWQCKH